jgi:hypothetical protein
LANPFAAEKVSVRAFDGAILAGKAEIVARRRHSVMLSRPDCRAARVHSLPERIGAEVPVGKLIDTIVYNYATLKRHKVYA